MAEVFEPESRAGEEGSSERASAGCTPRPCWPSPRSAARPRTSAGSCDLVTEVYARDPEIEATLSSPVVKRSAKVPVLEHAFKNNVNDLVFNLLNVLNAKDRLSLVRHVAAAFGGLLDERAKRVRCRSGRPSP